MDRQPKPGTGTLIAGALVDDVVHAPGKRTLVAEIAGGFGAASPTHGSPASPPAPRVAERERRRLNAVIKVVAYDAEGNVILSWAAKATWDGPLPQHFHGDHRGGGWNWDDAASARSVRVHTRVDGTGGQSVEAWASTQHAARVEIFAEPIDTVTEREQARPDDVRDPNAPGHADDVHNAGDGSPEQTLPGKHGPGGVNHQTRGSHDRENHEDHAPNTGSSSATPSLHNSVSRATPADPTERGSGAASMDGAGPDGRLAGAIAFELEFGIDLTHDEDAGESSGEGSEDEASAKPHGKGTRGAGYEGGSPDGRSAKDAATTGQGPGGNAAREGGDDEGSTSTHDNQGTKRGDRDGEHDGSEHGRYAGEGRDGDDGVRGAGAIFGGVVAVPEALQGAVEFALLIDAGDITGAGGNLFKAGVGKGLSIAAARRLVAREARIAAEREARAVAKQLATRKALASLSKAEQERVLRIVYWEKQRQFFRGYLKAARAEQRAVRQALTKAKSAERAALEARQTAAQTGEEIAKVEPVAGQLPRNHGYAGHEFPPERLPPRYQKQGLRFKDTGYPDFEPYAKVLPNGQKKVRITYTGMRADAAAANKAAGFRRTPDGWTWHHDEADLGTMYLVPDDLHTAVKHSGGVAEYKHRHGVVDYE